MNMQLILNMIEKVSQLTDFKQLIKNQNFSFNFTNEKYFSIDEKYFLNHKSLTAADNS